MTRDEERYAKARREAQAALSGSKRRDSEAIDERRREHAAAMAKMARLREQRLAHEAAAPPEAKKRNRPQDRKG